MKQETPVNRQSVHGLKKTAGTGTELRPEPGGSKGSPTAAAPHRGRQTGVGGRSGLAHHGLNLLRSMYFLILCSPAQTLTFVSRSIKAAST